MSSDDIAKDLGHPVYWSTYKWVSYIMDCGYCRVCVNSLINIANNNPVRFAVLYFVRIKGSERCNNIGVELGRKRKAVFI